MKSGLLLKCMLIFCLFLPSCGSNSSYDGALDCNFYCDKNEKCCDQDPLCDRWDGLHRDACMNECDEWNKTYTEEFLEGLEECIKLPCNSEEASLCAEMVILSCTDPPAEQVDSICTRRVECLFDTSMQACTAAVEGQMVCYSQKAIDAMESCSLSANCNTFHDDFVTCFENELGLKPRQ